MRTDEVIEIKKRYAKILGEMERGLSFLKVINCPACDGYKTVTASQGLPNPDQWEEQCSFCEYEGQVTPEKFLSYWSDRMNFLSDEQLKKELEEMPF